MHNNMDIRLLLKANAITVWQLGQKLGVSENTIHRWLRFELPEEKRNRILVAVKELKPPID